MDTIDEAWEALRRHLEARARQLAEEVRGYPGPIARCDEQLPALIGERSLAMELARAAAELERERDSLQEREWQARLAQLAWSLHLRDEAGEALHRGLVEALRSRCAVEAPRVP
jgi:hypothetical protein